LLGTPHLEGRTGITPQGPRRIAILASLAASGPGGLTRDKLIALLWPEGEDDRSRRNLSQLLYAMRTELGADLVDGTGTLRLDPALCTADVMEFDAAVASRLDADAVRIYTGPFLDGFHLAESSEFSQWADVERERRITQVRAAALRVAEAANGSADAAPAWRKALALDPLNAPIAMKLMDALVAGGDRSGALRVAEQHAALARTELEGDADPKVLAKATEIRRTGAASGPAASVPAATPAPEAPSPGVESAAGAPAASGPIRPRARRRALLAAGVLVVAVLGIVAWTRRPRAPLADDEFVLIAQFVNQTPDSLIDHTLSPAVAAALQQSAFVVPLPRSRVTAAMRRMNRADSTEFLPLATAREVAEREHVRFVIAGELLAVGVARRLITQVIEPATGRVVAARSFAVASDEHVLDAIDLAARQLRRDLGEARSSVAASRPLPEVTTSSLAALREYGLAMDAERRSLTGASAAYFNRAVQIDPDFAAAHVKLAEIHALNNDVPNSRREGDRALELAERLPMAEQLRIKSSVAWSRGDREAMVAYGRTYVELRPRDFTAWVRLGFTLFSAGQHTEAIAAYAKADQLSPLSPGSVLNWGTAWMSRARQSQQRVDFDSARAYYERAFRGDPSLEYDSFYNHQYGTILLWVGIPDSARATFMRMRTRSDLDRARAERSLAYLDAYEGDWTSVAGRLADAADIGTQKAQWTTAVRNDALVADAYLMLGDRRRAEPALRRAAKVALREPLEARVIAFVALAHLRAGELATAKRLRDRMRALARPEHDAEQAALSFVDGAVELASGNAALAHERIVAGVRRDSTNAQGRILLARSFEADGQDAAALAAWDAVAATNEYGAEGQFEWQFADAERGRLLERIGRRDDAVNALRQLVARFPARAGALEPPILSDARDRLRRLEAAAPKQ